MFQFAIDRGGTFTDVWARCPSGKICVLKLLSDDPSNYPDAPREAIKRILQESGDQQTTEDLIDASKIDWIRMGTTIATNALLERNGKRMVLAVTKGFKDLLHIGNQTRPNIFDLVIKKPDVLYDCVIEVEERLVVHRADCQLENNYPLLSSTTSERLEEWQTVNVEKLEDDLRAAFDKGINSIAVILMHSFMCAKHEHLVGEIARQVGFTQVSLSSVVMPMAKIVPRGFTACIDAYLSPGIRNYINSFMSGFQSDMKKTKVQFMKSDGGLTCYQTFNGSQAILSGPAGGVVGHAMTTYSKNTKKPVIGFDMGGTSTDVSRYDGNYEIVFEASLAGLTIQSPQLDIQTVAAGGGSVLFFRSGLFVVGPASAGAHPGPACYRKGGPLTITDANLVLGRLLPEFFPEIFGANHDQPLDFCCSYEAFRHLTEEVNSYNSTHGSEAMSVEEVAMGFINVTNETMCRPIRAMTQEKGRDTSQHVLACFGGAGGQHACAIARLFGMSHVFIHRYAGVLSAYGLALADVVHECQEPCSLTYCTDNFNEIDDCVDRLQVLCIEKLTVDGFSGDRIRTRVFLHLRYTGTDCPLMVPSDGCPATDSSSRHGDFLDAFLTRYRKEFGFLLQGRCIIVNDVRVRGTGLSLPPTDSFIPTASGEPHIEKHVMCFFDTGFLTTAVYKLDTLLAGHSVSGPAFIVDSNNTIIVEPFSSAEITISGDIRITVGCGRTAKVDTSLNATHLSIFSHRFMSIAEQMGRILQRASISTNIKERLDFSCALFGSDGGLVSNAPHIPVHLGAMQETVQYQMCSLKGKLYDGDVILSNHPMAGGSHLPDLTVVTPVFSAGVRDPVFYVACRGHHADIGGISPGSMPPHSTSLQQEGAMFVSFKLVERGVFQEEGVKAALLAPGQIPGCSGTRNLQDNLSDLRAQVAANQKGIQLVKQLIQEYSLPVVQAYMSHIQANAEVAVRDMLRDAARTARSVTGRCQLTAADNMDDGSIISLTVGLDESEGTAEFDFSGSSCEVHGNLNAPRSVTMSAIIYCLRSMLRNDIPLNQGCLKPINVIIPNGSILHPSDNAAVVGGNVLTSQRVVDVIFRAFEACAASQGCMNNITFGDDTFGYYETVAGGSGAGPGWHGCSGVHTHMTNTRITDPEILEQRYPVVLKRFHLNAGTGGSGAFCGGDGVVREFLFRKPLTLSVLTERRVFSPYGLKGGGDGHRGVNLLICNDGRRVRLNSHTSIAVLPGDVFRLETPGGGGYGGGEKCSQ